MLKVEEYSLKFARCMRPCAGCDSSFLSRFLSTKQVQLSHQLRLKQADEERNIKDGIIQEKNGSVFEFPQVLCVVSLGNHLKNKSEKNDDRSMVFT